MVGFAVIPGITTFNAVTLFPGSRACLPGFTGGGLGGNLIATPAAGWAYVVEYRRSEPGRDYIAMIPLSSLRLQTIGRAGNCAELAQAPAVTTNAASGVTSSGATLNGSVNPGGQGTTYQFGRRHHHQPWLPVPSPTGYAGAGTSVVNESARLTGPRPVLRITTGSRPRTRRAPHTGPTRRSLQARRYHNGKTITKLAVIGDDRQHSGQAEWNKSGGGDAVTLGRAVKETVPA